MSRLGTGSPANIMADIIPCTTNISCRRIRYANLVPSTSCDPCVNEVCVSRANVGRSLDLPSRRRSFNSHSTHIGVAHRKDRRRSSQHRTYASQAGYAEPHMSIPSGPAGPPQAPRSQPGAVWTAIVLICATFMALAGAFTAFVVYMRPVLKRMESAAQATETASKAMEQSAKEFEHTSLLFQADTPSMIAEIKAAAQEYHQLGQTLNIMTAGFRGKNPVKDWSALSMKRMAKDVSALTSALSPAMDQWRKRISRIATNFEVAHKAELKTVEKRALDSTAKQPLQQGNVVKAESVIPKPAEATNIGGETGDGPLHAVQDTGKQLANAAVSLTPDSAVDTDAAGKAAKMHSTRPGRGADGNTAGKLADMQDKEGAVSTQQALDLLDAKDAQTGADAINEAADAAEKVATEVTQLVADLAQGSHDADAVEDAYQHSKSSQDLPGMSEEEQALLSQLATKKQAAEQVFRALQRAEHAATAAATASGALEQAMQEAESQGVLSSSDEVQTSSSSSSTKYRRNEGRDAKSQGKRRQANLPQTKEGVESSVSATAMDSASSES